jgi:hypothetical protein
MPVERRERVIAIGTGSTGNGRNPTINGKRQPSCGDTSRMNREVHVRFCEGFGVEFPGPTRPDLPTWALQQVGSSPGYTGREALLLADRRNLTKAPTDAGARLNTPLPSGER